MNEASLLFYREHGYLILRQVFSRVEMLELVAEMIPYETSPTIVDKRNLRCRWAGHCKTDLRLDAIDPVIDLSPKVSHLAHDRRLLDPLDQLLGGPTTLFKDKWICRFSGSLGQGIHQDYIAWKNFPLSFTTALVAVEAATKTNGCLEVFSGCHRDGNLSAADGEYHELRAEQFPSQSLVPLEMEVGDVAFFGAFLPHRAGLNATEKSRRHLYLSYHAGPDQRAQHYGEFLAWLKTKYEAFGITELYFK